MIKPSEFTPRTAELMARMFRSAYRRNRSRGVPGGPDVGAAFAGLPFDHLLFTGATSIAYHVSARRRRIFVPTTLELGGKSPVIIGRSADIDLAAKRMMMGKTLNAGQICLAPDYVMVPEDKAKRVRRRRRQARVARDVPDAEGQSGLHLGDQRSAITTG